MINTLQCVLFCNFTAKAQVNDTLSTSKQSIEQIKEILKKTELHTKTWSYCWTSGYAASAITQSLVGYSSNDRALKQDLFLGATTSALGIIGIFISPLNDKSSSSFSVELNDLSELGKWNYYNARLKKVAMNEQKAISWQTHALFGVVSLGSGIITWLAFKRSFEDGLVNFGLNTMVAELQILTTPTLALKRYNKYSVQYTKINWSLAVAPTAIGLKLTF